MDMDKDGALELIAGGHNAARDQATVIVLDPAKLGGASVEPDGAREQILDLPAPTGELARIYFPRGAVSLARRDHSTVAELYPDSDRLVAQVFEVRQTAEEWAFFAYVLAPNLVVERVRADEFMLAAWDRVRAHDPNVPLLDDRELQRLANETVIVSNDPRFDGVDGSEVTQSRDP